MDKEITDIVGILDNNEAEDVMVLDVQKVSNLTSYFIVATANSDPHMEALRDKILEYVKKDNIPVIYYDHGKGYDWMVVDCGFFIAHLFSKKGREFYSLEDLWLNAKSYKLEEILNK